MEVISILEDFGHGFPDAIQWKQHIKSPAAHVPLAPPALQLDHIRYNCFLYQSAILELLSVRSNVSGCFFGYLGH
jgi:hypothetical protein